MRSFVLRLMFACGFAAVVSGAPGQVAAQSADKIDQSRFPTGLNRDLQADISKFPLATLTRAYIPEAIDLSASFPPAQQQRGGSCVAWATGYAARSYYARLEANAADHSAGNIPSPAYIYNNIYDRKNAQGCEKAGSTFLHALAFLKVRGSFSLAEYGVDQTCKTGHALDQSAPNKYNINDFQILSYLPIRRSNPDLFRQKLAAGHPVLIGMQIDREFTSLRPAEVYKGRGPLTAEQLKAMDGHAMVLVGYDDRRRAFRLLNSWSQSWGDGGFGWISYEAAVHQITDSYVMVTPQQPPKPQPSRPTVAAATPQDVAKLLTNDSCSDVRSSFSKEQPSAADKGTTKRRLTGFVSKQREFDLVTAEAGKFGEPSEVQLRPWPVCEAMLHLREPLEVPSRPTVTTLDGKTSVKVGDTFGIKITTGDVPSFLYAFYLEDDGTVVNLLPRNGVVRAMTQAKTEIRLGDGKEGRPTFRATPLKTASTRETGERGYEAVVVIAARSPVDELEDLEKPDALVYRVASRAATAGDGPPDRLMLSVLRDIMQRRADPTLLQREVGAAVLQLKIEE